MISKSPEETQKVAEKFLNNDIKLNVVLLSGELGSGKTQFVKGIGKFFKIKEEITSPTFVLIKEYPLVEKINSKTKMSFNRLIHIDLYRLKKIDNFIFNQIMEYSQNKSNLVVIEWPEKLSKYFFKNHLIKFEHLSKNKREITIK